MVGSATCRYGYGLPAMPMTERIQLTRAIAEKHGHRLAEVDDWRPLLDFTQGNPLTVTVLVGQALRDGLHTRAHIEKFVGRLQFGETSLPDDEREGRSSRSVHRLATASRPHSVSPSAPSSPCSICSTNSLTSRSST